MCMSNLPIEFDENGDPYLAEAADDVEQPTCGCEEEVALADLDPESAFDDIAESVPDDVLEHLESEPEPDLESEPEPDLESEPEPEPEPADASPAGGD